MSKHDFWNARWIHQSTDQFNRQLRAFESNSSPQHINYETKSCQIRGSNRTMYNVSLENCTCPDYVERQLPCKHMYQLADELDIFDLSNAMNEYLSNDDDLKEFEEFINETKETNSPVSQDIQMKSGTARILSILFFIVAIGFLFLTIVEDGISILFIIISIVGILLSGGFWTTSKEQKKTDSSSPTNESEQFSASSKKEEHDSSIEIINRCGLNYSIYSVRGKNKSTNRQKKLIIKCHKNQDIEELATQKGLLPPYEIEQIPLDKPSDEQLSYAESLGIIIPSGATKEDVSCLISRSVDNDISAPQDMIDFADSKYLCFSYSIGSIRLRNLLLQAEIEGESPSGNN